MLLMAWSHWKNDTLERPMSTGLREIVFKEVIQVLEGRGLPSHEEAQRITDYFMDEDYPEYSSEYDDMFAYYHLNVERYGGFFRELVCEYYEFQCS
jgi:hypothetical protein